MITLAWLLWLCQEPELVSPLGKRLYAEADAKGAVTKADEALAKDPENLDLLLTAARARDEVWRFGESIALYTRGIGRAPDDFRFYRFRGHRYISTRQFDKAASDLEKAWKLAPSSFDVAYHLGLAYYLQGRHARAAEVYGACLAMTGSAAPPKLPEGFRGCAEAAAEDNSRVAITEWRYRALRRAGRDGEARKLLETIDDAMKVTSNDIYYRSLLFYRGLRTEEQIFDAGKLEGNQLSTLGYALANHHWLEGRRERACQLLRRIVGERTWSAFGYIAAETELARGACR